MTIKELKEQLARFDPEAVIVNWACDGNGEDDGYLVTTRGIRELVVGDNGDVSHPDEIRTDEYGYDLQWKKFVYIY